MTQMQSKELQNIRKVGEHERKRVLLINPKKIGSSNVTFPHNGLAILSGILKKRGHETLIVDYAFLRGKIPSVFNFIEKFKPDLVGVSMYAFNAREGMEIISEINKSSPNLPIITGGPFATLYTDELKKNKSADYIFIGEAELTLLNVVENAKKERVPKIINSNSPLDLNDIPIPEFKSFYQWEIIRNYPIMTSRGCPFKCSFCVGINLAHKRWRHREIEGCIKEIKSALEISPHLRISIFDDCPTVWKERFKQFLRAYKKETNANLNVINTRADGIDRELLILLKECNCREIGIGVEHAHPEVFKHVNKGETLKEIEDACNLVKDCGFGLTISFVVGLPYDNLERIKESIKFANRVKPNHMTINPIVPFRGTPVRAWFEKNGTILRNELEPYEKSLDAFECEEPYVETPDFNRYERRKAFYMFMFRTGYILFKWNKLRKVWSIAKQYGLKEDFMLWIPKGIKRNFILKKMEAIYAIEILRKEGVRELIRRHKQRIKLY
ncbi:MAG: B12-binding domain-containing radical SAM protein [Nanoarchaeota archaeon]|nr:B12-binding domain-containing radical SAM protein [Nanoarchaeota archaeon]